MSFLEKFSTAFTDFKNILLRKHVEEFILTVPSGPAESGIPLKQIRVDEMQNENNVCVFKNVDMNDLERFLFPATRFNDSNRFSFYTKLLKENVLVLLRGRLKAEHALDGYVGFQGDNVPRIRSSIKRPGESVIDFLENRKKMVTTGPVVDTVTVCYDRLLIGANQSTMDLYLDLSSDQSIIVYREIPSGIFGFEESNSPECMICCDTVATSLLLPCGHTSTCDTCTRSFRDTKCPICRSKFSSRIFLPIIDTRS